MAEEGAAVAEETKETTETAEGTESVTGGEYTEPKEVTPEDKMYGEVEGTEEGVEEGEGEDKKTEEDPKPDAEDQEEGEEQPEETDDSTEDKPKEEDKSQEELKLEVPENSPLTDAAVQKVVSFLKDSEIKQEDAQRVLELQHELLVAHDEAKAEAQKAEFEAKTKKWGEECRDHGTFGGEQFNRYRELSRKVTNRFASKEFREFLNTSGMGNYPGLFEMTARIGEAMAGDEYVSANNVSKKDKPPEDVFYGGDSEE